MRPGVEGILRRGRGAGSLRHARRCGHRGVAASRRMGLGTRARAYDEPSEGDLEEEEDEYPDLSLWSEESPSVQDTQMVAGERGGGDGEGESEDYDERSEAPRESWSRRNDTTARKKGRTWHKYMKNSRELKRLQSLLPDLEGGSLFADEMRATDIEALDAETSEASLESVENLRNLEQQLDRSGFAYIAKGGKVTNMEEVMRSLGWSDPEEEEEADDAASLAPESILVDLEEEASTMEVDARDPETLKLRAKLDAMEDHPWKRSTRAHPEGGTQEIEVSLGGAHVPEQAGAGAQTASSGEGPKGDWAEYENPTLTRPAEQRILEKAMYSSTIRMIHDQEQQSIERARVTWFLKEQFNSEFVLSNYLAHMARSIQEEVDGIEVVNYKETGTFICRYKPMIMSKVLFDLETKLKTGEIDIDEINHLQDQSNRKADLLEKTIAFLCDRSIRMQVAKHLRRNLSFKRDQLELDPADRLDLDRLEEALKVERVENIIVKRAEEEEEEEEETILDFLLKEDGETQSVLPEMPPSGYETLKPRSEVDLLPDLPEDALIQFSIDGECVEIDLSKIGEQAIWIRQLLGYKQSDAERMANFDRLMHKTETAFQVKPRKRRDKRTPVGQKQLAEKDESRMFQEAVDIFGADNN